MCSTIIHHLIHFCQPSGVSGASYGPKTAILAPNGPLWSHFHTTWCVFLTSFAARVVLPHVFNCDPPFDPLLPATRGLWGHFLPKMAFFAQKLAILGHFHTIGCIFLTSFASKIVPPHVFHCDTPFNPLLPAMGGHWGHLWPKMAVLAQNWPFLGPFHTIRCTFLTSFATRVVPPYVFH